MRFKKKETSNYQIYLNNHTPATDIENINIAEESVYKIICQLKPSKSQSPDNFRPTLIKEAANEMKKKKKKKKKNLT